MIKYTIYYLSDQDNSDIFYVGITDNMIKRMSSHKSEANKNKGNELKNKKIRSLRDRLEIHELIYCNNKTNALWFERELTKIMIGNGHKLLNGNLPFYLKKQMDL